MSEGPERIIGGGDFPCIMCGLTGAEQRCNFWVSDKFTGGVCETCIVKGFTQLLRLRVAQAGQPETLTVGPAVMIKLSQHGLDKEGDGHERKGGDPNEN